MNTSTKVIITVLLLALIGSIGYTFVASQTGNSQKTATTTPEATSMSFSELNSQTVATSTPDGEYYAYIKNAKVDLLQAKAILTLQHVTYFMGAEARASALNDITCKGSSIEACVPTLLKGYYVRESGAPMFDVAATISTKLVISTSTEATLKKNPTLQALGSYKPVIRVTIRKGAAVSIEEITKP